MKVENKEKRFQEILYETLKKVKTHTYIHAYLYVVWYICMYVDMYGLIYTHVLNILTLLQTQQQHNKTFHGVTKTYLYMNSVHM